MLLKRSVWRTFVTEGWFKGRLGEPTYGVVQGSARRANLRGQGALRDAGLCCIDRFAVRLMGVRWFALRLGLGLADKTREFPSNANALIVEAGLWWADARFSVRLMFRGCGGGSECARGNEMVRSGTTLHGVWKSRNLAAPGPYGSCKLVGDFHGNLAHFQRRCGW
jgi:hypothetical protein